jgi:ATP-dependent Clp protease adaptor protein ClpS
VLLVVVRWDFGLDGLDSEGVDNYCCGMAGTALPQIKQKQQTGSKDSVDPGYVVICWNDPVNLMDYVTHVFQAVFGWPRERAQKHMLQVHQEGKSVLAREGLEKAEFYVHQLQKYHLHATLERAE